MNAASSTPDATPGPFARALLASALADLDEDGGDDRALPVGALLRAVGVPPGAPLVRRRGDDVARRS
jgi:hypothetical protein